MTWSGALRLCGLDRCEFHTKNISSQNKKVYLLEAQRRESSFIRCQCHILCSMARSFQFRCVDTASVRGTSLWSLIKSVLFSTREHHFFILCLDCKNLLCSCSELCTQVYCCCTYVLCFSLRAPLYTKTVSCSWIFVKQPCQSSTINRILVRILTNEIVFGSLQVLYFL